MLQTLHALCIYLYLNYIFWDLKINIGGLWTPTLYNYVVLYCGV